MLDPRTSALFVRIDSCSIIRYEALKTCQKPKIKNNSDLIIKIY